MKRNKQNLSDRPSAAGCILVWCINNFSPLQVVIGSPSYYEDEEASLGSMYPEGPGAQTGYVDSPYDDPGNEALEEPQPKRETLRGQRLLLGLLAKGLVKIKSLFG